MEYTMAFEPPDDPDLLLVTCRGAATRETSLELVDAIAHHPSFRAGMPILVDDGELDMRPMTAEDIRVIADAVRSVGFGGSPVAIVAPARLTFGLVRMAGGILPDASARMRPFATRDEAVRWLESLR
jgi:hypothetical protein